MASNNNDKPAEPDKQSNPPSTGEGADSVLDALRRQRTQKPVDPPPPPAEK